MNIKPGVTGAKRQSFYETNPRAVLIDLIEAGGTEESIHRDFLDAVYANPKLVEAIVAYWFPRNYASVFPTTSRGSKLAQKVSRERARVQAASASRVEARAAAVTAQIQLLNLGMPNGKKLRYCTGAEVAKFAPEQTPWLARVAARTPKDVMVGQALSEAEVRELYS